MAAVRVLIPTIPGREESLTQVSEAWQAQGCRVFTCLGFTCGGGWNFLASAPHEQDPDEVLMFASDDAVPRAGAASAGLAAVEEGFVPHARFFEHSEPLSALDELAHGRPVAWTRLVMMPRARFHELGGFIDTNWYTDMDMSRRIWKTGGAVVSWDGFEFDHLNMPRTWFDPVRDLDEQRIAGLL